jgi:hypothetical protein
MIIFFYLLNPLNPSPVDIGLSRRNFLEEMVWDMEFTIGPARPGPMVDWAGNRAQKPRPRKDPATFIVLSAKEETVR